MTVSLPTSLPTDDDTTIWDSEVFSSYSKNNPGTLWRFIFYCDRPEWGPVPDHQPDVCLYAPPVSGHEPLQEKLSGIWSETEMKYGSNLLTNHSSHSHRDIEQDVDRLVKHHNIEWESKSTDAGYHAETSLLLPQTFYLSDCGVRWMITPFGVFLCKCSED